MLTEYDKAVIIADEIKNLTKLELFEYIKEKRLNWLRLPTTARVAILKRGAFVHATVHEMALALNAILCSVQTYAWHNKIVFKKAINGSKLADVYVNSTKMIDAHLGAECFELLGRKWVN